MLAAGRRRVASAGVGELVRLEQGRAESLPFEDESFDAVTFTYLLRYVDDPAAPCASSPGASSGWKARLARVLRAAQSCRPRRLGAVRARRAPARRQRRLARMGARRPVPRAEHPRLLRAPTAPEAPWRSGALRGSKSHVFALSAWAEASWSGVTVSAEAPRPAFYALAPGGWRDYATLLHPPYTAWHLSYVAIGAALAADFRLSRLLPTLAAFFLAVGIGAHALDELHGRPARHRARVRDARPARRPLDCRSRCDRRLHGRRLEHLGSPSSPFSAPSSSAPTTWSSSAGASTRMPGLRSPGAPSRS